MQRLQMLAAISALAILGSTHARDAPIIYCNGWGCGGTGLTQYAYPVDSVSYPMMEFKVGTNDLNLENYHNVLIPPGWSFSVEPEMMNHLCASCGNHTPHGVVSLGPCWCLTLGCVRWWTDDPAYAVELFTFGFNHPYPPEDVSWELTTRREGPPPEWYTFTPFWDEPMGVWPGMGPVHGPCLPAQTCYEHGQCSEDFYCFWIDCELESGWCMPRPVHCPEAFEPVCGCDGVTYENLCVAALYGESVDYEGPCIYECPADVNDDEIVNVLDLLAVIAQWGESNVREDINGDGIVDVLDLLEVIALWGPC